jgi:hypothetical protein
MANPFSGLENIGQSYLQGVQLANQRQYREEAAAQRAEDTRVRQQYYTQMGADREAALKERTKARMDQFASVFGKNLKLTQDGDVDIPASALARDRAMQEEQLASAEGELGALYGTQAPLSPEVIGSPAYQTGRLRGTAKRMAQEKDLTAAMIRRGFMPANEESDRELPEDVRNQIEGFSPDIFSGGGAPLTAASMGAGAPAGGGQQISFAGRQWNAPAARAGKAEKAGTMKFTDPNGVEYSLPVSPEAARDLLTKRLASPEGEQDPYADIDEAYKTLKKLRLGKNEDFNLERLPDGTVKVVPDKISSWGYSAAEIKKDLELERKNREQILKESKAESETMPDSAAGIKQGTNRVPSIAPNRVTDYRSIPNLPRIGRGTNAPVATTNAPPQARLPVDSLAPASSMSSESLGIDPEELRQAMLEAQSNGMDPAVLGLQIRQALNEAGVPTAAGTNSIPFGLSNEKLDAILRLPRGRAPVEL